MKRIILLLAIVLVVIAGATANQNRLISGTVYDESGNAIPGVSILIEGSTRGTMSNVTGFYKIEVEPKDKNLQFSFVGMITEKVKIPGTDTLNVVLKADKVGLDEVVVIAYGVQKKASLCGAVSGIMVRGAGYAHRETNWNTENYSTIHENGFKAVKANPLSTFSIDVDRASYSNVRRYINQGIRPPVDAVKVEEMINYFGYDYPDPTGEHPCSVTTEVSACPWNTGHYLMHIGLQGKHIDKTNLPASNLVFLLDVSGSMNAPDKLPLVKRAFNMLVNELRPEDRVAIVVYAGAAGKVLDSTPGNKKKSILDALEKLGAGGSTAGGEGLKLAYKIAEENFIEGGNNRIILATDGDFNVGVSSTSEMERLVEKEREKGVFMTVLGFGSGNIKDDKMEVIADKGNGNYAYIDNIREARKVFITEFGGTLFTIAKDVKFQLEFNPKQVKSYRLIGYENRLLNDEDFNDDKKDAGEMGAGHTVTALYEIVTANSTSNKHQPSVDQLKYQNTEYAGETSIDSVLELARGAKGDDEEGYRAEFIQLVKMVNDQQLLAEEK